MMRVPGCGAGLIHDPEFTRAEIEAAAAGSRLLALQLELGRAGGTDSQRCASAARSGSGDELTREELRAVVLEAAELGARRISILGEEPTRDRRLADLVRFVKSQRLEMEICTGGGGITADLARVLHQNGVGVVLRMDALDEAAQEGIGGSSGSHEPVRDAFEQLKAAGYPTEYASLGVETLVSRHNIEEIPSLWRWLRDRGIVPRLAMPLPGTGATADESFDVGPARLEKVFAQIADIERVRYGRVWEPSPPFWGGGCMRHKFSCMVCRQGDVVPCAGLRTPIGNVREQTLAEIIEDSEILEDLRDHARAIKGPCASCEEANRCYGCRGAAYQLTGDYLASDPLCRKNAKRQDEIARLPIAASELIPHQAPMCLVEHLVRTGERSGEVSTTVSDRMPFVGDDGVVDAVAYVEMVAQSIAALNGFKRWGRSARSPEGYLVGARKFEVLGSARVGDALKVSVHKDTRFGNFGIITGSVSRNDTILARGELKIWRDVGELPEPARPEE